MQKMFKFKFFRQVSVLIPILIFCLCLHNPAYAVNVGVQAPDFTLQDLNGKKVRLSELSGKVIVLNFWATYCVPCRNEMPSLARLYKEFRDKGLVVIGISIDASEKAVSDFVKRDGIEFPVLMDKDKEAYFDIYALFGLPATVVIDRSGRVADKVIGEREWDSAEMRNKFRKLLDGGAK